MLFPLELLIPLFLTQVGVLQRAFLPQLFTWWLQRRVLQRVLHCIPNQQCEIWHSSQHQDKLWCSAGVYLATDQSNRYEILKKNQWIGFSENCVTGVPVLYALSNCYLEGNFLVRFLWILKSSWSGNEKEGLLPRWSIVWHVKCCPRTLHEFCWCRLSFKT